MKENPRCCVRCFTILGNAKQEWRKLVNLCVVNLRDFSGKVPIDQASLQCSQGITWNIRDKLAN